jgi:hypothetical protein
LRTRTLAFRLKEIQQGKEMVRNIFLGSPPIDSLAQPAEAEEMAHAMHFSIIHLF